MTVQSRLAVPDDEFLELPLGTIDRFGDLSGVVANVLEEATGRSEQLGASNQLSDKPVEMTLDGLTHTLEFYQISKVLRTREIQFLKDRCTEQNSLQVKALRVARVVRTILAAKPAPMQPVFSPSVKGTHFCCRDAVHETFSCQRWTQDTTMRVVPIEQLRNTRDCKTLAAIALYEAHLAGSRAANGLPHCQFAASLTRYD